MLLHNRHSPRPVRLLGHNPQEVARIPRWNIIHISRIARVRDDRPSRTFVVFPISTSYRLSVDVGLPLKFGLAGLRVEGKRIWFVLVERFRASVKTEVYTTNNSARKTERNWLKYERTDFIWNIRGRGHREGW